MIVQDRRNALNVVTKLMGGLMAALIILALIVHSSFPYPIALWGGVFFFVIPCMIMVLFVRISSVSVSIIPHGLCIFNSVFKYTIGWKNIKNINLIKFDSMQLLSLEVQVPAEDIDNFPWFHRSQWRKSINSFGVCKYVLSEASHLVGLSINDPDYGYVKKMSLSEIKDEIEKRIS